ncbi:hypothetical protein H0E87_021220 [Populus deltoides]|uniref:Uncharacterized protein n=1 Tax=Populus deltoides TaxID=3696 RepID=A0A8T2XQN5_POPDE|nr:hypothetical protein H0E87_021220 [Populus deltoides]
MWVSLVHDDGDWFGLLVLLEWDIDWRLKGVAGCWSWGGAAGVGGSICGGFWWMIWFGNVVEKNGWLVLAGGAATGKRGTGGSCCVTVWWDRK